ncbi:MAG: RIP metalloprotease RseP [Sulfuricella sp.]|nr:RIP metalloprotease RseP [Sulfuricella sp.]
MSFLFTLAAFAVTLGIMIVVHEYGHYQVARWCGVKVLRFSVGFGKPLLTRRWGADQTEWVISIFPLGGYVKMLDEQEGPVAPHELHRAYNRLPVQRRIAVVAAGPLANLALAVVLYWFLFMHGVQGIKPMLGEVPAATPAAHAGFQRGEVITRIGGETTPTWQDARWTLLQKVIENKSLEIEVETLAHSTAVHTLDVSSIDSEDLENDFLEKLGLVHFQTDIAPKIGSLLPDGAAAKSGLQVGDEIMSVNRQTLHRWEDWVKWVRQSPNQPLTLKIQRGEVQQNIEVTPDVVEDNGKRIGRVGAAPLVDRELIKSLIAEVRYPPHKAFVKALGKTWETSIFSLKMLFRMVAGQVSWKNISGPITIADYAGQSAQMGVVAYLSFLALISISLGVLNLLPVPLLDGGHLLYYMVEFFKGSPVSEKTMEIGQQIGIAILLTLMLFAFYNDINRLISGQ